MEVSLIFIHSSSRASFTLLVYDYFTLHLERRSIAGRRYKRQKIEFVHMMYNQSAGANAVDASGLPQSRRLFCIIRPRGSSSLR